MDLEIPSDVSAQSPFATISIADLLLLLLRLLLLLLLLGLSSLDMAKGATGVGVNWGSQASHKLPPAMVVQMLKDNGVERVKLFDSDPGTLRALAGSGIEVMVAIPNKLLRSMTDSSQAIDWVHSNVVAYVFQGGVNIKYVAVGNEPFLRTYNGSFLNLAVPALRNVQNALNDANLGDEIKATVPSNADILTDAELPSQGRFRTDVAEQMTEMVSFLAENRCPFTINIYPFISLYNNPNFPIDYAFFGEEEDRSGPSSSSSSSSSSSTGSKKKSRVSVGDGSKLYRNVFDASFDTLVAALEAVGFGNMPIVVGEIGWPTDGFELATPANAQRFNQGFLDHMASHGGTPRRPGASIAFYLFSLLDEDLKSIEPGSFERHWGIFRYDGMAKYPLSISSSSSSSGSSSHHSQQNLHQLVNARGVRYLPRRWCILSDSASSQLDSVNIGKSVSFACTFSDCTSLGYGSSCNPFLDSRGNASFAFNQYFQINSQRPGSCYFDGLASITFADPSVGTCDFIVQLATSSASRLGAAGGPHLPPSFWDLMLQIALLILLLSSLNRVPLLCCHG